MKYIFLDVDGVLNIDSASCPAFNEKIRVDRAKLPLLKRLVDVTGAQIVLASSWRCHEEYRENLGEVFAQFGLSYRNCTPYYRGKATRGEEISAWLSIQSDSDFENRDHAHEIRYVILDDFEKEQFAGHGGSFIQVDYRIGLTEADVDTAIEILGEKQESGN